MTQLASFNFNLQQERGGRRPDSSRRSSANSKPSKTLFVINFDPVNTRTRDLERHFEHYGKISNVRIRRNFAFVQYELQEDATRALESANMRFVCYTCYGIFPCLDVFFCGGGFEENCSIKICNLMLSSFYLHMKDVYSRTNSRKGLWPFASYEIILCL